MGQQYSAEVFKPPDPPTYTEALAGLFYISGVEGRRIPAVFHEYCRLFVEKMEEEEEEEEEEE
jgi:hypothetical protein